MKPRFLAVLLCVAPLAGAQTARCEPVEGDRIVAKDLAASLPGFAKLAPDTPIAPAPPPGVRRVFRPLEISALARRYSVDVDAPGELCFEYPVGPLDRVQALEAMRQTLADFPDTRIEIVETSLAPVPRGRIEFLRDGLATPSVLASRMPVEWRGNITYGESHRFSVSVRVLVSARLPRVVALARLKRGSPVIPDQIRVQMVEGFPGAGDLARAMDQVVGRVPLSDIAAGSDVHLAQLATAPDVARGDMVEVEVRSGAAHLVLTGKAESAGRAGDSIAIRNLSNNRIFQARIDGKDKAFVDAGRAQAN